MLEPEKPFILEVNASAVGIGAVLSQCHCSPQKLYLSGFFSRKLLPVEHNYDISNCKLLPDKAALEEWHHWLEGVKYPFMVLTILSHLYHHRPGLDCPDRRISEPALSPRSPQCVCRG